MKEFFLKCWNNPKFCMFRYVIPLLTPILLMDNWYLIFMYVTIIIGSPFLVFKSGCITTSKFENIIFIISGGFALFIFVYASFLKTLNVWHKQIIEQENKAVLLKCLSDLNITWITEITVFVLVISLLYISALPYCKYLKSCKKVLKNENTHD